MPRRADPRAARRLAGKTILMSIQSEPSAPLAADLPSRVWRIEVHPLDPSDDPLGHSVAAESRELRLALELREVRTARVYLIQGPIDQAAARRIAQELLTDPVNQRFQLAASPTLDGASLVEVHYLPGVMDPVAQSTEQAIAQMLGSSACQVRTAFRYDLLGAAPAEADLIARRLLANPVIQSQHTAALWPDRFPAGAPYSFRLIHVPLRDLDEAALMKMSRQAHLFLSLAEMKAIQDYYLAAGREPTDIELETLAQTWSEHCVHKTLKSRVSYRETAADASPRSADWAGRPGHQLEPDGTLVIDNLLKSTIAAATHQLMADGVDWCVSVFKDNAGVIRFDDAHAVTFKVETHNRPSAIEPYGGAATGIGGCIRDTMGTGLSAKPIANTDIFCVADPAMPFDAVPKGVIHPRRVLKQVVAGVRDYGNRMGIPTVNGLVYFDDRYLGNPLVFAGSVGLLPLDKCFGRPQSGDRIVALGGRTGRDGIHGATFSSAELTDTHADEFAHAVQIGNAITQKKMMDVILQARDAEGGPLYHAITDCGAGGFSSAVGEMGHSLGAFVQLDNAPLKYDGLSYTEVWISEAQERMILAVPAQNLDALRRLCESQDVEWCDLGHFGTPNGELILTWHGNEVGRLSMRFVHEGIPTPTRSAEWRGGGDEPRGACVESASAGIQTLLPRLLAHPNIASKHWIIRQYDHEVQGGSVVKPLTGAGADGPSDAAVIRPKLDSPRGVALSCGLVTALGDIDPYWMTLAAIDEAVRNAVCVGARPDRVAILDNFCWAKCDLPENFGALVRAAEACYDGALAYRAPFISGKDSLNNQFTREDGSVISIPPTLLISAIGVVDDVSRCVTMDAKRAGNLLLIVGHTTPQLGGSHLRRVAPDTAGPAGDIPRVDLRQAPRQLAAVAALIAAGHVRSAHDCSEGGLLVAAAEMSFAGRLGLELDLAAVPALCELSATAACFAETPSRVLVEVEPDHFGAVAAALRKAKIPFGHLGAFNDSDRLTVRNDAQGRLAAWSIDDLRRTWTAPLDW
jgi:phosphoribosylformylglycinamidine synthase